jgi:hypothetical protein
VNYGSGPAVLRQTLGRGLAASSNGPTNSGSGTTASGDLRRRSSNLENSL